MSPEKTNLFKKLAAQRKSQSLNTEEDHDLQQARRGRPATGKRSNPDWIGRTYYIRKETDLDIEEALHHLKREGFTVDKSELVDFLLSEWVKHQNGKRSTFQIGENTK